MIMKESEASNKMLLLTDFPKTKEQSAKFDEIIQQTSIKLIPVYIKSTS